MEQHKHNKLISLTASRRQNTNPRCMCSLQSKNNNNNCINVQQILFVRKEGGKNEERNTHTNKPLNSPNKNTTIKDYLRFVC